MDKAWVHTSVSKTSKEPRESGELTRDIVDLSSLAKKVKPKESVQVRIIRNSNFVDAIKKKPQTH